LGTEAALFTFAADRSADLAIDAIVASAFILYLILVSVSATRSNILYLKGQSLSQTECLASNGIAKSWNKIAISMN
jgi:hypothetical protein